ncbi:cell division protein FtsZ [Kordiimonas sp. SCSIO 12610]|uniref:cell division protein FtsZ n=1 Tax=Kordiimonas sp. SCSIO 12610 TaxID=2829597 RepID=UPI002108BF47|nr:cell division protein FtsZ [Kordiimonas sp. SCSIO 12610]UTW56415.1 cell division protein FtsZ [Kordiimonas sp. SCSIO 12610]
MSIDFENTELTELTPKIAVIGVGGAGGNAVNNMITSNLQGVDFVVANTDAQALSKSGADTRIQLGVEITQGLGAGAQPKIGEAAAEEALERVDEILDGCHMAFITAGMGGGTGTGAAPVIARRARERGILTVGVVTKPFQFEGGRRMKIAEAGIQELAGHVDTLIIVPNQNLFRVANERTTFAEAFNLADEVLHSGVRGITDLMVMPGLINLDFADVRTVMSEMGKAMMGTGEADGETRAQDAAAAAISNPLLEEASLQGAKGVIINVTGGMDMTLYEVDEAVNMVREQVDPEALIVFGSAFNQELDGKLRVSVVATGIEGGNGEYIPRPKVEKKVEPASVVETEAAPAATPEKVDDSVMADIVATGATVNNQETVQQDNPADGNVEAADREEDMFTGEHVDETTVEAKETFEEAVESTKTVDFEMGLEDQDGPSLSGNMIKRPSEEAQAQSASFSEEEVMEERALAEQEMQGAFVADAPMTPKVDQGYTQGQANIFQEAAYASGAKDKETVVEDHSADEEQYEAVEPATVQPAEPKPEAKRSLFQLMTAGLRGGNEAEAKEELERAPSNDRGSVRMNSIVKKEPTVSSNAGQETGQASASVGGVSGEDRPAAAPKQAKDQLEIPSFLKRQQN